MRNRLVELTFFKQHDPEIVVSHPAARISRESCAPERFDIAIHCRLSPRQCRQDCHYTERRGQNYDAALLEGIGQINQTGRDQGDGADTGQILIMIGHKRVAECVKHDEPQHRAERRDEKCGCDLNTASRIPAQKIDYHASDQPC